MTLAERYAHLCATPSSINELLPTLRHYAEQCESVTEFGVDIGQSTTAFLMAQPARLLSVDPVMKPELAEIAELPKVQMLQGEYRAKIVKTAWYFWQCSSLDVWIPKSDMLLIDSAHCYAQIKEELARHASQVRRWILCHDYIAYGEFGEAGPPQVGILPAIKEFLAANPSWCERERIPRNNGLLIMERV